MIIHDSTVDRTTNGMGSVYDMSLAQIQKLDAGYWLVPGKGTDHSSRARRRLPLPRRPHRRRRAAARLQARRLPDRQAFPRS